MKNLFLTILIALIIFSQIISFVSSKRTTALGLPVIYWSTDLNPARIEQIALFRKWLAKRGLPDVEVRLDTANAGLQKALTQTVTGVAADVMDQGSGSIQLLQEMGVLKDMSEVDKEFGYKFEDMYEPTLNDIIIGGKHYGFPCNIGLASLVVNVDTFRKVGMEPPPFRNSFEAFEAIGLDFVTRANAGKKRRDAFFFDAHQFELMRRSLGVSYFNETLTRSMVDCPEFVKVLKMALRWTDELHLAPSAAEVASIAIEQGYGGSSFQLFNHGNFAMMMTGRWAMIQIRSMGAKYPISIIEYPNGGYPNAMAMSRSVVVYQGTKQPDAAKYFCAFLRSEDYNMHIVHDSDGNTGETPYLDREEFLRPAGFTNEWGLHQGLAKIAKTIAIGREYSPFVLFNSYSRYESRTISGLMAHIYTAEETTELVNKSINAEIDKYLGRNPDKMPAYRAALERQKKIDDLKARGKKIPLSLVDNSFLKRYYRDTGRGE